MSKLLEGRKALPDEWFVDRANNWGRISPMTDEERNRAREKELHNMNRDEVDAAALVSEMHRQNLTCKEALRAMQMYANDKMFQDELDKVYGNDLLIEDEWDNWYPNDSI